MAHASHERRARFAARNARGPRPGTGTDADGQPHEQRARSFLAQTKDDFAHLTAKLFRSGVPGVRVEEVSQVITEVTAYLFPFVAKRCAASYWAGVSAGASGKVQPKERRGRANAEGD